MANIRIERLPGPETTPVNEPVIPWFRTRRFLIFASTFLVTAIVGLLIVFLRPPIYRASASLLTTAAPPADYMEPRPSSSGNQSPAAGVVVDPQHVAIQRVILTAQPLLMETIRLLELEGWIPEGGLTPADIKQMLSVEPVPDTNLVELRAEGTNQDLLAPLVNTWIDVYMETRTREIRATTGATLEALKEQLGALEGKIETKRQKLAEYRRRYDIASLEREENEALARLKGLMEALNTASEEEVQAKARLDAIRRQIAAGKPVVPESDERVLAVLETRAQELNETFTALKKQFTPQYLRLHPQYRVIPKQLKEVEEKIANLAAHGQEIVLSEAEQAYATARQSARKIQQQIQEQKKLATEFSTRFTEHEALLEELKQMEFRQRELQDRIAQLEIKQLEKYPQVDVVERAYRPVHHIRPHYWRDAGFTLAGSLVFGLLAVWLAEYLSHKNDEEVQTQLTFSGVHVYAKPNTNEALHHQPQANPATSIEHQASPDALAAPMPRELTMNEIETMLAGSDLSTRQCIAFLLSGLLPDEVIQLSPGEIEISQEKIRVPGDYHRSLPLAPRLKAWMAASGGNPLVPDHTDELSKQIYLSAVDAGLDQPETINAWAVRHTYLLYLVKQGIKISHLEKVAGPIPLPQLSVYGRLSPPGSGLAPEKIHLIHPCLEG